MTFNGKTAAHDWYAVSLRKPALISKIVFAHGRTYHDGGWFDASAGKPRVQIKTSKDGDWQDACEIKDYPATTATDPAGLKGGDILVEFDGKPIQNLYDFTYALRAKKPGQEVLVKVLRGDQTIVAKVLLTERK